ncbi:MAG: M15 family metallopeptidase [Microbacterium sp.]
MNHTPAARRRTRWPLAIAAIGLVVVGIVSAALAHQATSSAASSPTAPPLAAPSFRELPGGEHAEPTAEDGAATQAEGSLPAGVTVFDDQHSGIADLDPELLDALRRATTDAARAGIELIVSSGRRSPEYQDRLFDDAVARYGSEQEAARWVAPADASAHVSGDAVDIGGLDAIAWLSSSGAGYGLCQVYSNESWHYEFRPGAIDGGCPAAYADPSQDPRMQR